MTAIRFLLECAIVAVAVGALVSSVVAAAHVVSARWTRRWAPSLRADWFLVGALLPGAATVAVTLAAAGPSFLASIGLHHDHCVSDLQHAHLCLLHPFDVPLSRTLLGVFAIIVVSYKAVFLLLSIHTGQRAVHSLEALGTKTKRGRFTLIRVPGGPSLCHAVGVFRRRVLLSESLAEEISLEELDAALAHEDAHHERFDGLASFLIRMSALFYFPIVMRAVVQERQTAAEEAADARAAKVVGDARLVANALVSIARVQISKPQLENGITGTGVERRVARLLGANVDRPSPGVAGVIAFVGLFASVILLRADQVHHVVERLLHLL